MIDKDTTRQYSSSSVEEQFFLSHPVPLWVYDRETLRFLAVNDAAVEQYGFSREQFLAMRVADLRAGAQPPALDRSPAHDGRRVHWRHTGVIQHRTADGRIIHAELTTHDLVFNGRPAIAVAAYDITERIRVDSECHEAEQRLSEAQALAGLGSWQWDARTDTVLWSEEMYRIAGRSPELGAPRFNEQEAFYAPEDWPRLVDGVQQTLKTGIPYALKVQIRRPDGSARWIVTRGAHLHDATGATIGLHGTAHDVTERHLHEQALEAVNKRLAESESRYRELVENLDDVVFALDTQGTILFVSQAVEHYGYAPEELVGRTFAELVYPDDRATTLAQFAETLAGNRQKREFRVVDKHGQVRHVRSSNRARMRDGHPIAVTGVLIDITDQRRTQDQLRAAGRLEAVGRLAGGVAHDFNNLLVAINGFAEMALLDVPEGSQLHDDLAEIVKAGNRAAALTHQLLAFSRNQTLRPDCVDLNDIVTAMEPMLRRLIGEDIDLVIACAPAVPRVRIDTGHLEQVIMNLVVNARDAMPQGGVIQIGTGQPGFPEKDLPQGLTQDDVAVLSVSDTGVGMDETTQAHIFEPFFTTKPLGQGTGLGLAMVYGFVKQSGGAISAQSAKGSGSTFRIALPKVQNIDAECATCTQPVERGTGTVLVVEDDLTVRNLVQRLLEGAGYQVLTAESPDSAVEVCRTHDGTIDLLLTDVVMPQMSGPALVTRVAAVRPSMRVLFMSGYTGEDVAARGLADERTPLLHKPFSAASLTEAVRRALEAGRG